MGNGVTPQSESDAIANFCDINDKSDAIAGFGDRITLTPNQKVMRSLVLAILLPRSNAPALERMHAVLPRSNAPVLERTCASKTVLYHDRDLRSLRLNPKQLQGFDITKDKQTLPRSNVPALERACASQTGK